MFRVAPAFLLISVLLETGVEAFYTPPDPFQAGSGAYPLVTVIDSTEYNIYGEVAYASIFCGDDDYDATPSTKWKAKSRGICLVCAVHATVETPRGDIVAKSYETPDGCTTYSQFAVISDGNGGFLVTRVVT